MNLLEPPAARPGRLLVAGLILGSALFEPPRPAAAATFPADSCARADVQAAIDAAADGDTVVVPPGTCSWTEGIAFNKAIHLVGQTPGAVTLLHDAGASYLFEVTESPVRSIEIANLRFVEASGSADAHLVVHPLAAGGRPVLVHDCYFETGGGLLRSIRWRPNRGVLWSNQFYSNREDDQAIVFVDDENSASWSTASTMGADDLDGEANVYVEDNLFLELYLQALDPDSNSRVVVRHNVFDNSGMASHGADTSLHGTRHWEIYDNTFLFTDHGDCSGMETLPLNWYFYIRGGTGVIADNTITDISSCAWGDKAEFTMTVQNIRRDAGPFPCWIGYPAPHQVGQSHDGMATVTDPVYIWGNTGVWRNDVVDYQPDECGNGQSVADYVQEGRDFVYGPRPGYAKYAYPHPLRSALFADSFESGDASAWSTAVGGP